MKNFQPITIKTPCQQKWNDMTEVTEGRYCNSCEKVVTDFTTMSNQQIIDFIAGKDRAQICGRFKKPQLHSLNQSLPVQVKTVSLWKRVGIAAAVLFCSLPFFKAEAKIKPDITMHPTVKKTDRHEITITDSATTITITGKVIADDDKQPVQGVTVRTDNGKFGTMTDANGNFKLTIQAKTKKINVAFIGYQPQIIKIKEKNIKNGRIDVTLKIEATVLGGIG